MELLSYFTENVDEKNPYFQFKEEIELGWFDILENSYIPYNKLHVVHPKEAIRKFKDLCQPANSYGTELNCQFILICFYLYQNNYFIEEFPELLNTPLTLGEFAYGQVRTYLIGNNGENPNSVPWQSRRNLINQLRFKVSDSFYLQDQLNETFRIISTRGAEFHTMSNEEKLKEIANMLEFILKKKNIFLSLDTKALYFNYITNDDIISYRKRIQCFRHSSEESLEQRKELLPNIDFFISYGLTILAPLKSDIS